MFLRRPLIIFCPVIACSRSSSGFHGRCRHRHPRQPVGICRRAMLGTDRGLRGVSSALWIAASLLVGVMAAAQPVPRGRADHHSLCRAPAPSMSPTSRRERRRQCRRVGRQRPARGRHRFHLGGTADQSKPVRGSAEPPPRLRPRLVSDGGTGAVRPASPIRSRRTARSSPWSENPSATSSRQVSMRF